MKNRLFTIALIFCLSLINAQETIVYPKGIYETFNDYVIGQPSDVTTIFTIKSTHEGAKYTFYDAYNRKRIKKPFAISDGKHLYLRVKSFFKHLNKIDKGRQLKDDGNYYTKSIRLGNHYHYYENYFTSTAAAVWGGMLASAAAGRIKGVVYNVISQEFNIFRNAKDFKHFIDTKHPKYSNSLPVNEKNKPVEDIEVVRTIIKDIF